MAADAFKASLAGKAWYRVRKVRDQKQRRGYCGPISELHMLITSFLAQALVSAGAVRDAIRQRARACSYRQNVTKNLPSCRERNPTFRETPGICEQAVTLNAPRGRAHRSVPSIP
jgi:hypothetical protein